MGSEIDKTNEDLGPSNLIQDPNNLTEHQEQQRSRVQDQYPWLSGSKINQSLSAYGNGGFES